MMGNLYLGAYWKQQRLSLREYIAACKRFLATLRKLHPAFHELVFWGRTKDSAVELTPDLSNLDALILRQGPSENARYSHVGTDGGLTLESECENGFITIYSNKPVSDAEKLGITITAGAHSPWLHNAVVINLPSAVEDFKNYESVKRLLTETLACWEAEMAVVSSHAFNDRVDEEGSGHAIGWMNWFRDSSVEQALPADVERSRLKGGVLVTTTRQAVSADSQNHVFAARKIRHSLQSQGF